MPQKHWLLLREAERGSRQIENWACLGCAHLNDEQEHKRCSESINKELIHVTLEPEELKDTLPNLLECIHDFETQVEKPDLLLPTADQTLDNLARQALSFQRL